MKELRIIVERVVRPLHASVARKQQMREELFAHVTAAFDEEMTKDHDQKAALDRTSARFGDPAALRAQLQQSVPAGDWIRRAADRVWSRPGESWWRRALRRALLIAMLLPILCWLIGVPIGKAPNAATMRNAAPALLVLLLLAVGFTFLAEWMRHALYRPRGRSWTQLALIIPTCGLLSLLFVFCEWRDSRTGWAGVDKIFVLITIGYGLLWIPAALGTLAHATQKRAKHDREWADLELA